MKRSLSLLWTIAVALVAAGSIGCESEQCDGLSVRGPGQTCVFEFETSVGETRSYRIHVPTGYVAGEPTPLVFNIPGVQEDAERHELRVSEMSEKADQEGFIVIYPDHLDRLVDRWRTGPDAAPELAFFREMLERTAAQLTLDPRRLYVTGISNGGGMVHTLACEMSDVFAAYAPVTSLNYYADYPCNPVGLQPFFFIFGEKDPLAPWPDGVPLLVQPPPEFAGDWAVRNGATGFSEETGPVVDVWRWTHPFDRRGNVTLLLGHDLSHTWPKLELHGYEANNLIWDFFVANPRP